jgi:hypothetical protein
MTKGSHLISIIYGLTIYSAPTAIAALKDKAIGFTGNRTALHEPTVFVLQQDKAWAWTTVKVAPSDIIMKHYNNNVDKVLFKPQTGTSMEEKKVPNTIVVPPQVIQLVLNLGGSCTPVGLHKAIETLIQDDNLDPNKWELVLQWCLVTQHADSKDAASSCLAQTFTAVTTEDEMFQTFCTSWIDLILGPRNNMPHSHITNATPPTQNPQVNINSLVNDMACIITSVQGTPTSGWITFLDDP